MFQYFSVLNKRIIKMNDQHFDVQISEISNEFESINLTLCSGEIKSLVIFLYISF